MAGNLFDVHNHLQDFAGRPDFEKILGETRDAGVARMVVNGSTEADWPVVADLARRYPDLIIPAFGLHPWYVAKRTPGWFDTLEKLLREFPDAAVGEIGLDRWIPEYDWADQVAVFLAQWRLAVALGRPAEVHCLRAFGHLEQLLRDEPKPSRGWLLHSYGGPEEMVPAFVKLGASFSFSGYFLHTRKIEDRSAAFRAVPRERLLIETDAPDMAPPEGRRLFPCPTGADGKPENHPGNLASVAKGLAEMFDMAPAELAALTMRNAGRMFL
jgi:TatD DNase family protein